MGEECFLNLVYTYSRSVGYKLYEEDAFLAPREASSCIKKGMFSNVEGRLLLSSSASFRIERSVITEIS